jgi:hypothetical protein
MLKLEDNLRGRNEHDDGIEFHLALKFKAYHLQPFFMR